MFIALKPSAKCAWAAWTPGMEKPVGGSFDLPTDPLELGRTGTLIHRNLRDLRKVHGFERIFYERPKEPGDVRTESRLAEIGRAMGIVAHIASFAYAMNLRATYVGMGSWRRDFLGKGVGETESKFDRWTRQRCRELGWRVANRDEADARGILDYGVGLDETIERPWRAKPFASFEGRP